MQDFGTLVAIGEVSGENVTLPGIPIPGSVSIRRYGADLLLGYDSGDIMPFGGLGFAQLDITTPGPSMSSNGFAITGGVAYRATDNILLDARVRHTRYSDFMGLSGLDADATTFLFGVSWHN